MFVCLFVFSITTQEPLERFVSDFDWENSGEPRECALLGYHVILSKNSFNKTETLKTYFVSNCGIIKHSSCIPLSSKFKLSNILHKILMQPSTMLHISTYIILTISKEKSANNF